MGIGAPLACCITPTRDRPELLRRTIESYKSQDYRPKVQIIINSGKDPGTQEFGTGGVFQYDISWSDPLRGAYSVGYLRNRGLRLIEEQHGKINLIAHFDDDDWSAPERLTEQVAFMEHTGADVVGYCDMPFYDAVHDKVYFYDSRVKAYTLGTALLYKREVWEKVPFPDVTPEDTTWQHSVARAGFTICSESSIRDRKVRMIQTLHGGNASAHLTKSAFEPAEAWLDQEVRRILAKVPA